ncbi:MAG TPA: heparinase II/III family protein, partial [Pyrinomonadaceae bacterium]
MNPLDKLKKLKGRSWTEIRARGEQALSVYTEQIGLGGKLPTDDELPQLLNKAVFGKGRITTDIIFDRFFELAAETFFPAFRNTGETIEIFRQKFKGKPIEQVLERAEKITEGKFDLLGYTNLDFGNLPIDWHFEPLSGKHLPLKHWKRFDELDTTETGDKKIVWELNRHQHFFTLGLAFRLTGEERYAAAFARHIDSWMEQNPPGMGINWFSSLEVALRAISWIWAFHFFKDSDSFTPALFQKALKYLYLHGRHIEKYLSVYYSPNTHLTGEALGLYYLGSQLEIFERARHWRALGEEILFAELDRQIHADGVYFEQSTWYGRYTADFYTHFLILKTFDTDDTAPLLQEKLESKLQSMLDFQMYITQPDGTTPLIGDDDGGRSLPLSAAQPDDFGGVLATAAIVFGRGDYKFAAGQLREETLWLLGADGVKSFDNLRAFEPRQASKFFAEGGYFAMRDGWTDTDNFLL